MERSLIHGYDLLAQSLKEHDVDLFFFVMGGPLIDAANACVEAGLRAIDVRHEQAAAMMAHAYSRVLNRPSVCMAASGPGTANLVTGIAHAFADAVPVIAIGGSSPVGQLGRGAFQEIDQLALMKPITRWAGRVYDARRIPEMVDTAFRLSWTGQMGPVYLDVPGDVAYQSVPPTEVPRWTRKVTRQRPQGDPELIKAAVALVQQAKRPVVLAGSGVLWSGACAELQQFVETVGAPFFTTPQSRGVIPEDHDLCFLEARATAFGEADLAVVVGTRANYMWSYLGAPRFSADLKVVQVDIDSAELSKGRSEGVGIVGDAGAVLCQLTSALADRKPERNDISGWIDHLRTVNRAKRVQNEAAMGTDQMPIHPLRLCREVRDFMNRDSILVVDGQEILNFGRQSIPTFMPGHRLNSGTFGTMGVGLPFGIGAKLAEPKKQVIVLHGDGSFGLNAMELDTAVRHEIPVMTVISNNGGWTAADRYKAGRELGFTRYDLMAEALGCHGEYVERPDQIRPALQRAAESGRPSVVNVMTDPKAQARTVRYSQYTT